ncbi:MAG: 2-oxoacid:acceptor oxidoreductase subunit alpha [Dehalococcoidales bacterium]|nr:2-oxoacid:acceptor oxidoreductase subunit alpha [Dehalococcoidales bacterium]
MLDLNIMIGGEAGQGIQTIGFVVGKTFSRGNLHVFSDQDYESRVRGGHNFYRVRVKDRINRSQTERLDMLVALDRETVERHLSLLKDDGMVVADSRVIGDGFKDLPLLDIPLEQLAMEAASDKIMGNAVAAGAVMGLIGFDFALLENVLRWHFKKSTAQVQDGNVRSARAGYDYAAQRIPSFFTRRCRASDGGPCLFLNANEAIALGAMAAGCKFVAAYPMTPVTSIMEYIAGKGRSHSIAVVQPEDEIAAINMVIGAAYAGARAMTATSGSGFALMVEGLGLAGIAEIPAVIVLGQRPGPAVGLPTRTEQGELLFAVHAGTGEFPRVILAPENAEEAFFLTVKAFNLAEKFQVPVIILTDTHLANSYVSVEKFDLDKVVIDRGELFSNEAPLAADGYKRYALTESGISPRAFPLHGRELVVSDSDEHDETGHLTESAEFRTQQVAKRLKKYAGMKPAMSFPVFDEVSGAELTLIGWGSTGGAIREAAGLLREKGTAANILHLSEIWPFPVENVTAALRKTGYNVVVENNASGQMADLIGAETGFRSLKRINRWDGRPVSAQFILDELKKGVE